LYRRRLGESIDSGVRRPHRQAAGASSEFRTGALLRQRQLRQWSYQDWPVSQLSLSHANPHLLMTPPDALSSRPTACSASAVHISPKFQRQKITQTTRESHPPDRGPHRRWWEGSGGGRAAMRNRQRHGDKLIIFRNKTLIRDLTILCP
jgi:hypothetical protein